MDILSSFEEFKVYIDSLSPMELEKFVHETFLNSGRFDEVTFNPVINNRQIDIGHWLRKVIAQYQNDRFGQ